MTFWKIHNLGMRINPMIPRLAIITANTLEATGLKSIIDDIIPVADVVVFNNVTLFQEEFAVTPFYHFFVSPDIIIEDAEFFLQHSRQTFVLSSRPHTDHILNHFHLINTNTDQHSLIKELLVLHQTGHSHHRHPDFEENNKNVADIPISNRESEVLALVAKGFINKEIADKLCISLPTVVSHRKNICDKLHIKSVSALTIYAVTHGIVSVDEI